ncbi:TetR/AcrR family transcriptional regulator C-terminal domain-containing protein [Euzebya sp.]|uniref:TetR/AcrR family transcriptional regulator C-terminal domain-containing protein n=1 Tax=Euzebya sp. TaxID=1971409 RepID=UPI003515A211
MADSDTTYVSVWAKPAPETRSTLTRDQIVVAAMELLDRDGIEGLSMRNLASGLEVGATTLYWHVANRQELLALVVNEVYGEVELLDPEEADWRSAVRHLAHQTRAGVLRHPWVVSVLDLLVGDSFAPNLVRITEHMLVVLEGAGFALREAERALSTVSAYVLGISLSEAAWRGAGYADEQGDEAVAAEWQRLAMTATEDAPRLRALFTAYEDVDVERTTTDDFEYGLDRVLDGLQLRLDAIAGTGSGGRG